MSVYTKTGDKGKTGLLGGKRVLKSSKIINAIGAIDELNSYIGVIKPKSDEDKSQLTQVQRNLFTINSVLAGAKLEIKKDEIKKLEKEIDEMENKMPPQTYFLIYGGDRKARELYFARSLARKAERVLVELKNFKQKEVVLSYINRLSDYLFTLARFENFKKNIRELEWK